MRAQLRTYHSIPALQAHQDPNAYKQLQDAPRLKSILKGATEDEPQPSTLEEVKAAPRPRTNPVNLIFVMSQYAPKISETHFNPPRDFFDLVMRGSLSSASRARAFLWLIWWYLESDFSYEDSQRNPFGPGQYPEGEEGSSSSSNVLPIKVPPLESLTEEQALLENVDTDDEKHFGEVKRKERIAILASEPSPAMTALKRARKEKGLTTEHGAHAHGISDDERVDGRRQRGHGKFSQHSYHFIALASNVTNPPQTGPRSSGLHHHETGSEYTRSPSPAASRGFQAVNAPSKTGDMRINNLLNDDGVDASPPQAPPALKKGPGRGNWRRNRNKQQENVPLAVRGTESSHHVPLLPNTGQYNFNVNDSPSATFQPATPGSSATVGFAGASTQISPPHGLSFARGDAHIPTPSYQAQKRHRGVTQHQSAIISHRKQQIDYTLDRRIRRLHARAREDRESEGAFIRAWKRIKLLPPDYDSEEEVVKVKKARDRVDKDDDFRVHRGKDNAEVLDDLELVRRPKVLLAGLGRMPGEVSDVGEEPKMIAKTFRRVSRRLQRWDESELPGTSMIRRRQLQAQALLHQRPSYRRSASSKMQYARAGPSDDMLGAAESSRRGRQRTSLHRNATRESDEMNGLDAEERDMLEELDADESEDDEMDDE
jgi:Ino eighty subunit 1